MVSKYSFDNCSINCLVVDEAHYIKNESLRRDGVSSCIRSSNTVMLITGTPMENRVKEMISLIELLNPTLSYQLSFYANSNDQFQKRIAPVYLRRKRDDVLSELPELVENIEWCEMTWEENNIYSKALREHSNALAVFSKAKLGLWEAQSGWMKNFSFSKAG